MILFRATSRGKLAIRVPRGSKTLVQQKDRRLADDSHTIRFVKRAEEFSGLLDSWNKIGKIGEYLFEIVATYSQYIFYSSTRRIIFHYRLPEFSLKDKPRF